MQTRQRRQQDQMKRGRKTHEQLGQLGTIREVEEEWRAHRLAPWAQVGCGWGVQPTCQKRALWLDSFLPLLLPSPVHSVPSALPAKPRHDDNPACKIPICIDKGVDPGLYSRAPPDTSGLHLSCVQNSLLGPGQPVKSMPGNSHRSLHQNNQLWWKLKAIRNRAGFIFISNNMHCNGDHADGE